MPSASQVALTSVKANMGTLSYVEFVLYPESIFNTFVEVADKILEPIRPAGGQQDSEPQQQVLYRHEAQFAASLHLNSALVQCLCICTCCNMISVRLLYGTSKTCRHQV